MAVANKKKKKKNKPKRVLKPRTLRLKGWLKTQRDWDRFNNWVRVNGLPKKQPEPDRLEPRPVKPLFKFRKRLKVLAKPKPDLGEPCGPRKTEPDECYRASKRLRRLARPRVRTTDCKEWGVPRAALFYKASENVIRMAKPMCKVERSCKPAYLVADGAKQHRPTDKDKELAKPKVYEAGSDRCAKARREPIPLNAWMEFNVLPSYRVLQQRNTEKAVKMRNQIVEELLVRGRQALFEQRRKRAQERQLEKQRKAEAKRQTLQSKRAKEPSEKVRASAVQPPERKRLICPDSEEESQCEMEDEGLSQCETEEVSTRDEAVSNPDFDMAIPDMDAEELERRRKRLAKRDPWRFRRPEFCKPFPPLIKQSAKSYEASEFEERMAKPKRRVQKGCIRDPYKISKKALTAPTPPRMVEISKPKYPVETLPKTPRRPRDEYGVPVIPRPTFGRVLPKVKKYEMKGPPDVPCKSQKKTHEKKPEPDRIYKLPTIDPYFDPVGAARQAKARQLAMTLNLLPMVTSYEGQSVEPTCSKENA